jgi:hypothetical protein
MKSHLCSATSSLQVTEPLPNRPRAISRMWPPITGTLQFLAASATGIMRPATSPNKSRRVRTSVRKKPSLKTTVGLASPIEALIGMAKEAASSIEARGRRSKFRADNTSS